MNSIAAQTRLAIVGALLAACAGPAGSPSVVTSHAAISTASSYSVVYSFSGSPLSSTPEAGLIADGSGNLYGTAVYGGAIASGCSIGCGTIFELTPQNGGGLKETVLHSLNDFSTGVYPSNALVFDPAGNLYSATQVGGSLGTAFGLIGRAGKWRFKLLHSFLGGQDGQQPRSSLTYLKGVLYGTTVAGGDGGSGGGGTIYGLAQRGGHWKEAILHRFLSYDGNGSNPQAGVTADAAGNFYGTTSYGGNTACPSGCGTVFELSKSGHAWTEKVLHEFDGYDGATPYANLVWDSAGDLFGSTNQGGRSGCEAGCGTIFELTPAKSDSWKFSLVHVFTTKLGGGPDGNMVFDASGNLFGTTVVGGNVNACPQQVGCGVVFELTPRRRSKWKYTVLHIFNGGTDGMLPNGLVMAGTGEFFGTTIGGGAYSLGTVFEVKR